MNFTKGFSHFGLGVSDMDKSLHFYCDLLGMKLFGRYTQSDMESETNKDGIAAFKIPSYSSTRRFALLHVGEVKDNEPTVFISLTDEPYGERHIPGFWGWGVNHFSMWTDDLDGVVKRLKEAGVEIVAPPVNGDSWGWAMATGRQIRTVVVRDPDGNDVQLDQFVA